MKHKILLFNLAVFICIYKDSILNNVQYVFFRQFLISLYSSNCFISSRFLRSHTLPSVRQPGNLRIYTNASQTQNDWTLLRFPSLISGSYDSFSFQTLFVSCFCYRSFFLVNAGTYSGVHFPFPPFFYECYLLHM